MPKYVPENPPILRDSEAVSLAGYTYRELSRVGGNLGRVEDVNLAPLSTEPARLRDGLIALADGTNWDPGQGAGYYGYRNGAWRYLETTNAYDLASFCEGIPTANMVVLGFVAVRAFTIDISECQLYAEVAATAETIFTLTKNGSTIGTGTFAAAGQVATMADSGSPDVSVAIGDRIEVVAPGTPDATLADFKGTLQGRKN